MFTGIKDESGIKILVVEDEAIIAFELAMKLKQLGFSPLSPVNSGQDALDAIERENPDLVILDIKIRGDIDGIETAEVIRSDYDVPFIFFSAFSDDYSLKRVRKTEPYGFIPKNSTKIDLYTTIMIALQRFHIEKEFTSKDKLLSATLRSISDAVVGLDREGRVTAWNAGAGKIFGWSQDDILGENISVLLPPYIPNEIPGILEKLTRSGDFYQYDSLCQRKDGEVFNVSVTVSPVAEKNNRISGFSFVFKDISEKRELEKRIIDILEEERFRIGQDLHDNLGQYLTGILLKLKVLENSLSDDSLAVEKDLVKRISTHVKMVLERMRDMSKGLIALGLQKMCLKEALTELTSFFARTNGIEVIFNASVDPDIKNYRAVTQLYHIAQEALTNAAKHAHCSRVEVYLDDDATDIILTVIDDGKGFPDDRKDGLGLKIMKYRAEIINAHLEVYPSGERGTTVSCSVPKELLKESV